MYFSGDILSHQLQNWRYNYAIMFLKPLIIFLKGFTLNVNQAQQSWIITTISILKPQNCFIVVNCIQIILRLNKNKNYTCKQVRTYLFPFQSICLISLPLLFTSIIKFKNRHVTRVQFEWERPIEATDNIILFPVGFRLGLQDIPISKYLYLTSHYLLNISIE